MMKSITIHELLDEQGKELEITLVAGQQGLIRPITISEIHRPGLGLSGFMELFPFERIQIIGNTEMIYIHSMPGEERKPRLDRLISEETPLFVVTGKYSPPHELCELGEEHGICIFDSCLRTTRFISVLSNYLAVKFAPHASVHGVLVDVHGVGCLILGPSSVGKSEAALELIQRGHRLVADDVVDIERIVGNVLIGHGPNLIEYHMEIRGLGIINIKKLFGVTAVRTRKLISLVIRLEFWDESKEYDRTGLDEKHCEILGVHVPELTIPVRPGRNISVLIEAAAMNTRLKRLGDDTAYALQRKLLDTMTKYKHDI